MDISPELVRELLLYNPEDGVFTWRRRSQRWFKTKNAWATWNARYPGKRAGFVRAGAGNGYQCRGVTILDRHVLEHHLAWLYMTDDPLPQEIDHRNRDATDNRWRNLRASTHAKNMLNVSMYKSNTSGITGVVWDKRHEKWIARCRVDGKQKHIGRFDTPSEAGRAVSDFRAANGYGAEHGLRLARYHRDVK